MLNSQEQGEYDGLHEKFITWLTSTGRESLLEAKIRVRGSYPLSQEEMLTVRINAAVEHDKLSLLSLAVMTRVFLNKGGTCDLNADELRKLVNLLRKK